MSGSGPSSYGVFDGKNAYAVLGVEVDASDKVIKKAFRDAVKQFHPNGEAPDGILYDHTVQASKILLNPEKRRRLDISLGLVNAGVATTGSGPVPEHWVNRTATAAPPRHREPTCLDLIGQRGWHRVGFRLPPPFNHLTVPAGQPEGDIKFLNGDDSGLFPRDLIVRYRWPTGGFLGEDREVTLRRSAGHRWQPFRFKTEDGVIHSIEPPKFRMDSVLFGYGEPGEFDGPRGELVVHVEYHGKLRSQRQQQRRDQGWLGRLDRWRRRLEHPLTAQ